MVLKKGTTKAKTRIQTLVDLGLTSIEAKIYALLTEKSPIGVKEISQNLNIMPSSVHRSLKTLKTKELVITHGSRPLKIKAVDPSIALPNLVDKAHLANINLATSAQAMFVKSKSKQQLKVEFLESKTTAFERGINAINNTKNDVIVFSVGEPIPEELFLAFVRAIERGVEVRMIAQKCNKNNKELLLNWQKNGYKIKYLNMPELDFTLVVYDKEVAELHIRSPEDPNDRIGIVVHNSSYALAQYQYLTTLWDKATEI